MGLESCQKAQLDLRSMEQGSYCSGVNAHQLLLWLCVLVNGNVAEWDECTGTDGNKELVKVRE